MVLEQNWHGDDPPMGARRSNDFGDQAPKPPEGISIGGCWTQCGLPADP
jgi:hypothetical protein